MIEPAVIDALIATGASAEMIGAMVKADHASTVAREKEAALLEAAKDEARRAARREGNRLRQEARRTRIAAVVENARNDSHAVTDVTEPIIGNVSHDVTRGDSPLHGVTSVTGVSLEVSPKDNNQTPFLDPSPEFETRARHGGLTGAQLAAKADEFYAAYPKKVEPADAKAKFIRIVKSGQDPDRIIAAAHRFAEAHRLAGTERQFIKAPAVWLNKGGFDSEDLPEARAGPIAARSPTPLSRPESQTNGTPKTPSDYLRSVIRARADDAENRDRKLLTG